MAIERAKELKGKNGMIAGTAEYLNDLNSDLIIKQLTKKTNAFNYYRSIKSINNEISKPAGEILRDLKEYAPLLRYVPSGRRDTLKRFLNGLYELSGYTGVKESKLKQAISLADLSDSRTKKNSRASDRDIDKEVDIMYHGSVRTKGSLNNSSPGKGRSKPDDKFYMDIVNKYQYKYKFKGVLKGKNGVDIFSDKYIEHYEKEIFKTAVAYKHNGGKFTYVQFIKELLNGLYDSIIYDVDKGIKGKDVIKVDNALRLKIAVATIGKCGVDTTGFLKKMEKYQLEDVTKAMFLIMKNAKIYGHKRAAEFLSTRNGLEEFNKRAWLNCDIETLPEICNEFAEFYNFMIHDFVDLVATGAVYDIKIQYAFKRQQQYYFDGMVIDYDDTGNILYGVYGKALITDVIDYYIKLAEILHDNNFLDSIYFLVGLIFPYLNGFEIKKLSGAFINYFSEPELTSEEILHIGAGLYNIRSAIESADGDIEELNKVIKREFGWLKNYLGDDPRDYEAVELGYKYYDKV